MGKCRIPGLFNGNLKADEDRKVMIAPEIESAHIHGISVERPFFPNCFAAKSPGKFDLVFQK